MQNGRYTVFGRKKSEPAWADIVLCDTESKERYEECLRLAKERGYVISRVYKPTTELSAPDFAAAVRV